MYGIRRYRSSGDEKVIDGEETGVRGVERTVEAGVDGDEAGKNFFVNF
jgi:hypothetical protein